MLVYGKEFIKDHYGLKISIDDIYDLGCCYTFSSYFKKDLE